jgi:hypothetical protein
MRISRIAAFDSNLLSLNSASINFGSSCVLIAIFSWNLFYIFTWGKKITHTHTHTPTTRNETRQNNGKKFPHTDTVRVHYRSSLASPTLYVSFDYTSTLNLQ